MTPLHHRLKTRILRLHRKKAPVTGGGAADGAASQRPAPPEEEFKAGRTSIQGPDRVPQDSLALKEKDNGKSSVPPQADDGPDLWKEAFVRLSKDQQDRLFGATTCDGPTLSSSTSSSVTRSILDDLIYLAQARQTECERRSWSVKIGGNDIILRDQAAQVVSLLTKAGNLAMSFAPSVVQQIWPCVKTLLEIPVATAKQMAAMLDVADKVSRATTRGRVIEACFSKANTPDEALSLLQEGLIAIYKACLDLLATNVRLLGPDSNCIKQAVYSILHPDGVRSEAESAFSSLEIRLMQDVQAANIARSTSIDKLLRSQLQDLVPLVPQVDKEVEKILEAVDTARQHEILTWISPIPYSSHHEAIAENRVTDTCHWLLQHPRFQEWETSRGCAFMWLQGQSGVGKTFLTSRVIDQKTNFFRSERNDEALAFFYFSRHDSSRNSALSCLQSLVRQLSTPLYCEHQIRSDLRALYDDCKRRGAEMTWARCEEQVKKCLTIYPRTTIIIDALDECQGSDERKRLLKLLKNLMGLDQSRLLRVFMSGRPSDDLPRILRGQPYLSIGVEDNQDDIAQFIEDRVHHHDGWDHFPEPTKREVMRTLKEKSQGMFRWTALQIDQLFILSTVEGVEDRLGKLPEDLKTLYDEIYDRQIRSRGSVESGFAKRAIMWLMAAKRVVNSDVLMPVVRIDMVKSTAAQQKGSHPHTDYDQMPYHGSITQRIEAEVLLELCANLLTLDPKLQEWSFAHASVAEYFEANHFTQLQAHAYIASISLGVLMDSSTSWTARQPVGAVKELQIPLDSEVVGLRTMEKHGTMEMSGRGARGLSPTGDLTDDFEFSESTLGQFPLITYAAKFWAMHVATVDRLLLDPDVGKAGSAGSTPEDVTQMTASALALLLQKFLGRPDGTSRAYRFWLSSTMRPTGFERFELEGHPRNRDWVMDLLARTASYVTAKKSAAFTMAHFGGFLNLLPHWWPSPSTSTEQDGNTTALVEARYSRPVIDTTLRSAAGLDLLTFACYYGHARLALILLYSGLDANRLYECPTLQGMTALSLACRQGHLAVCHELIGSGKCNPNLPIGRADPLWVAYENCEYSIMRYLLSSGLDPNRDGARKLTSQILKAAEIHKLRLPSEIRAKMEVAGTAGYGPGGTGEQYVMPWENLVRILVMFEQCGQ